MQAEATTTPPRWSSRQRWLLVAIIAIGALAHGVGAIATLDHNPHFVIAGDGPTYERPALALLHEGRFSHSPSNAEPEFIRTPGYPGFIAAVYGIFGDHRGAVLAVQVLLSEITVLLTALFAARIWRPAVGLGAAFLVMLDPLQLFSSNALLTETLDTLLLVLVAYLGYRLLTADEPRPRSFLLLGFIVATATMVRPTTYYLPVFFVLILIVHLVRSHTPRGRGVVIVAAFIVPIVVIVGGWQVRNHEQVGSWRFSAVEAKNLYLFRGAGVYAQVHDISMKSAHDRLLRRAGPLEPGKQGQYYDRIYSKGFDLVTSHPFAALEDFGEGLVAELTSVRHTAARYFGFTPKPGIAFDVASALLAAFYFAAIYGAWLALGNRRTRLAHVFVIVMIAYVLAVSSGPETLGGRGERFRTVVVPILAMYAARGIAEVYRKIKDRRAATRRPDGSSLPVAST